MKATELLDQMKEREEALNFFLKKDYIEKLTDKEVFVLQNCEVTLEYYGVDGKVYDVTNRAYFVVRPNEERNCIDIIVTVTNGHTIDLYFTLYGIKAAEMVKSYYETFSETYEYRDISGATERYTLTIKRVDDYVKRDELSGC